MNKDTIYAAHRLAEAVEYREALDRIEEDAHSAWKRAEKDAKDGWTQYYDRLHELAGR